MIGMLMTQSWPQRGKSKFVNLQILEFPKN
jgi:hypothetical protein